MTIEQISAEGAKPYVQTLSGMEDVPPNWKWGVLGLIEGIAKEHGATVHLRQCGGSYYSFTVNWFGMAFRFSMSIRAKRATTQAWAFRCADSSEQIREGLDAIRRQCQIMLAAQSN